MAYTVLDKWVAPTDSQKVRKQAMSKYSINEPDMNGRVWIEDMENGKVFNGYDFMGSAIWEDYGGDAYWADPDEAEQIVADLEAADEPAEPKTIATEDQVRIVVEAAKNWLDHLNYRGICDDALWNAIQAIKAEM